MTDRELADQAWQELTQTTITYDRWRKQGFTSGHWRNAKALLDQIGTPPQAAYLTQDWARGIVPPWIKQGNCAAEPGKLTITAGPNSPGPFPNFYQAACSIDAAYAHAAPGDTTSYRVPIMFPTGYKATVGEFNWVLAWHVAAPTAGPWSCAMGVYTGGPVGGPNDPPGVDPKLFFVVRGGTIPNVHEKRFTLPSTIPLGTWQTHDLKFRWAKYPAVGRFDWTIDGQPVWGVDAPNMLDDGLPNGFGLYNYKRLCSWDSSINFGPVRIGP